MPRILTEETLKGYQKAATHGGMIQLNFSELVTTALALYALVGKKDEALKRFAECSPSVDGCSAYYEDYHNCGYEIAEKALALTPETVLQEGL